MTIELAYRVHMYLMHDSEGQHTVELYASTTNDDLVCTVDGHLGCQGKVSKWQDFVPVMAQFIGCTTTTAKNMLAKIVI